MLTVASLVGAVAALLFPAQSWPTGRLASHSRTSDHYLCRMQEQLPLRLGIC